MNAFTFSFLRAFLCDTLGLPFLEPVTATLILSPMLNNKFPFSSVISDILITPSDFLRTSTYTSSSFILTMTPSHTVASSLFKDSSNIVAKSSSRSILSMSL